MKIFNKKSLLITIPLFLIVSNYVAAQSDSIKWELLYHETFDSLIKEPAHWTEDTYGDTSRWHVDIFDDDGDFFREAYGDEFDTLLNSFRAFRKSFPYGQDDWLTFELYGRDEDKDGIPESGGKIVNFDGKAKLICERHTDGAIITTSNELPDIYRIEVTVSGIDFGGDKNNDGNWYENGKFNGYDGDEMASPWRKNWNKTEWLESWHENGLYYACIVDYPKPAPHNNVFIHHHRKVVMDTDNNNYDGDAWSYVFNPNTSRFEKDGNMFTGMIWLNGENFGDDFTGNFFCNWTPAGWQTEEWNTNFADKYIAGQTYTFTIERTPEFISMSVSGKFYYGGDTIYTVTKEITEFPVVWHYNRDEPYDGSKNELKEYYRQAYDTWPENSYYPDFFFCGDPHINFYEGSAEYDDIRLWKGTVITAIAKESRRIDCHLSNYPNPFNPVTTIQYQVPKSSTVKLIIYNLVGQKIDVLVDEIKPAGNYNIRWNASAYPAGIYIARLQVGKYTRAIKITLIK